MPEITDGTVTVVNICTEAGISRASYYRSPVAAAVAANFGRNWRQATARLSRYRHPLDRWAVTSLLIPVPPRFTG
ncbi:hypothetical protein ACIQGZ_25910 [Streptomyces sp. NPDC092296]|uniref:hypothetical protein n=1 Tax=Streptomyces sp. NPDC092296 TaxID=3366012 RepID=UPI00381554A3